LESFSEKGYRFEGLNEMELLQQFPERKIA